jgi:hypothetical protein
MIPTQGKGVDAVNFRSLKESESVDISRGRTPAESDGVDVTEKQQGDVDPFGDFNSGIPPLPFFSSRWFGLVWGVVRVTDCGIVTLHYDGDDYTSELYVRDHRIADA